MKKTYIVLGICIILLIIAFFKFKSNSQAFDPRGRIYAGSKECAKCHADIYKSYLHTAHFLASNPATANSVSGSFEKGSNVFYVNDSQKVVMEKLTNIHSLNRSLKVDLCAVCHSGIGGIKLKSTFEFVPGDTLKNFNLPGTFKPIDTTRLDVHGNQVQLLESSKCFIYSNMSCNTCHNVHQNNRGKEEVYIQKCLSCHSIKNHSYCKMINKVSDEVLKNNCIKCHMPALPSKIISVQVSDTQPSVQFLVHTHHIAIYPKEVKKILDYIKS